MPLGTLFFFPRTILQVSKLPVSEAALACLLALLATLAWTFHAGRDFSFDVVNHHLYLPYSLLSGRYATDLFAAGPQSYQNPLGYLPGYALVASGLPSWLVAIGLAALHALPAAWALHRISVSIWGSGTESRRWRGLAMAMAWCAPIFLLVAGTTSNDPLGAGLVLVAIAAALDRRPPAPLLLLGGLSLGIAIAIKPTNGLFALSLMPVLLLRLALGQLRWPHALAAAAAVAVGALAGLWHWSSWLWKTFGNPVFPLFNNYFHSPFAPEGATVALRFSATDLPAMIERLWLMATFRSYTVAEAFVPDLRPLLLALLVLAALLARSAAAFGLVRRHRPLGPTLRQLLVRADTQLLVLLAVSYPLWMASSGNARYLLPGFMLVGLMLVRMIAQLLPVRIAAPFALLLLLGQTLAYISHGTLRIFEEAWDRHAFLHVEAAPRLKSEPFLHLSIGVQTFAATAMFLHPQGALINISGQMTLPTTGPLGSALRQRLDRWQGRVRFLMPLPPVMDDPAADRSGLDRARYIVYPFGLEIDWNDCERLSLSASPSEMRHGSDKPGDKPQARLVSCAARPAATRDVALEQRIAQAEQVFKLIEDSCPSIYGPRPMASDVGSVFIQRLYVNTDARLSVSPVDGVTLTHFRSLPPVFLGSIEHVIGNRGRDACEAWNRLSRQ